MSAKTRRKPLIVLASTSRYRRELLARLGHPFEVVAPDVDESPLPDERPADTASRLALAKARAVAGRYRDALVIGADQVADVDGVAVSKPDNHAEALVQLRRLSGRTIVFYTAIAVVDAASGAGLANVDLWHQIEIPQPDGRPSTRSKMLYHFRSWEVETRIAHVNRPRTDQNGWLRAVFEPGKHRIGVGLDSFPEGYRVVESDGQDIDCKAGETVKVTFHLQRN